VTDIGIFAKTFARPALSSTLDALAGSGLRTMQFNLGLIGGPSMPDSIPATVAADIRAQAERRGLTMAAVSGTYNMAHPDGAVRAEGRRRMRELIASAPSLGTRVVTLCTGSRDAEDMWRHHPDNRTPEAWRDMLECLEDALVVAEEHAVTLAFEPEHNNIVDSASAGRRLLDQVRSPRLKVVIDAANLFTGSDLERQPAILGEAFELLGEDLVLAHAKDVRRDGTIVAAGHGHLDYERYLTLLGGAVPLILHGLTEADVPGCVAFLRRGLRVVQAGPSPSPGAAAAAPPRTSGPPA
jgi:sugar phosphate isomerase/epimerase